MKRMLAAMMILPSMAMADEVAVEIEVERRAEIKRPLIKDTQLEELLVRLDTYIQTVRPGDHRLEEKTVDY